MIQYLSKLTNLCKVNICTNIVVSNIQEFFQILTFGSFTGIIVGRITVSWSVLFYAINFQMNFEPDSLFCSILIVQKTNSLGAL